MDSDEKPYYLAKLKNPIRVGCSVDPNIERFETDEVYVREEAVNSEGWSFVTEGKPEDGFFREGWVVDFSKGQEIPIYQETTIKKWTKENRGTRGLERTTKINASILAKFKSKQEAGK